MKGSLAGPGLGAALVALAFACYIPSLAGEFLWDDDSNVSENPTLRDADGLVAIWASPFANQQFYPLTHTSFWVEYRLWKLWPTGFRITNLLLHGLAAALLWTVLRRLSVPGAWVAAAVFVTHPVHVESVAWITERKNVLSAVFYFAAMLAYLRFAGLDDRDDRPVGTGRAAYLAAIILFVCALLSKTAVVTLPAALLVIVWWKRGRLTRSEVLPTVPMFAVAAVFGLVTVWLERGHVGAGGEAWELGLAERLIVVGRAFWFYAAKLILPVGLNFIYPRWSVGGAPLWQFVFPAAALLLPVMLWRHRASIGRGPLAGVLFFGLTLAPALGFLDFYFQLYSFVQDHFQYLASAGLIALLVGAATIGLKAVHARAPVAAAVLVLLALGGLTGSRSGIFVSNESLWLSVLERNPRAWMADINLGLLYEERGRLDEAVERLSHSLETPHPEHDKAYYNLGRVLEQQGKIDEAEVQYGLALVFNPDYEDAHNNLGNLKLSMGDREGAIRHYRAALAVNPGYYRTHYNLALALSAAGLGVQAEDHLRQAIRLNPDYANAHDILGRILGGRGEYAKALESYKRALELDPYRPEVFYNMGLMYEQLNDPASAEAHYRAAIRLDPELAGAHNNLAIVLYHLGRYDEARQELRRYEELGGVPHPGFVEALTDASR